MVLVILLTVNLGLTARQISTAARPFATVMDYVDRAGERR